MRKYPCIYFAIIVVCNAQNVISQNLNRPEIACPDFFEYVCDSGGCFGKITLPNISFGKTSIQAQFSQRAPVISDYFGSIKNMDDEQTILEKIGRHEPLEYRVDFPIRNELPKLTKIAVNGKDICWNSAYPKLPKQPEPTFIDHKIENFSKITVVKTVGNYFFDMPQSGTLPFRAQPDDGYNYNSFPVEALHLNPTQSDITWTQPIASQPVPIAQPDDTYQLSRPSKPTYYLEMPWSPPRAFQAESIAQQNDPYILNPPQNRASPIRPTDSEMSWSPTYVPYVFGEPQNRASRPTELVLTGMPSRVEQTPQLSPVLGLSTQPERTLSPTRTFRSGPLAQPDNTFVFNSSPVRALPSTVEQTAQPRSSILTNTDAICGQAKTAIIPFVAGGMVLRKGQAPWLTIVYYRTVSSTRFICGGSIISMRTILSAAHCFKFKYQTELTHHNVSVSLGRYDLRKSMEAGVETRDLQALLINPEYNDGPDNFSDADIALLIMEEPVSFTEFIKPICLWTGSDDLKYIVNDTGYVAGWGGDSKSRDASPVPKMAPAIIVSESQCRNSNADLQKFITSRTFCAGQQDGVGPCGGDSGGGLMIQRSGRWFLRGVVSGGLPDKQDLCNLREFAVYCDVAKHISWIHRQML